ncbi:hypothetical protein [Bacillus mycoides]|uniref:hypothetical protein n=1 Tax=Bacillus mycoides TaxID=1405 RepID=UPI001FB548AE|nr:hypothetical protein [Bacillus mycoides]UNP84851.1 hypothetical protein MN034_29865 [Bacillus mycoides]
MNKVLSTSFDEYKIFIEEFYPKTSFNCTHYRKVIINLFTLVEVTDVYIDYLKDTNYLSHIKHQFLLMLYNLPNYNSFFITSLQRSISEGLLRMTLVSIGHDIEDSNGMPFYRIQEKLKRTDAYKLNQDNFKTSCDNLFSYFGASSKIMHNSPSTKQTNIHYIMAFNVAPSDLQIERLSKFLKVINDHILITFSRNNNINDSTLNLASKIQLKKIIGTDSYNQYFSS